MPKKVSRLPNASRGTRDARASADRNGKLTSRGERSRQQLLTAARTVFEREGFLHTRIGDICDEAGMSHGSFYTYFNSKEEIFDAVVDLTEVDLLTLDAPAVGETTPLDRIRSANRHYLETYHAHARLITVIQQVATFDDRVRKIRVDRQRIFVRGIETRIREYQTAGIVDARLDPWRAANALGCMVSYYAEYMFTNDLEQDLEAAIEQLTILWANALQLRV